MSLFSSFSIASDCKQEQVAVQVLGAGGPELNDGFASSSYLIWVNKKAQILIDAGTGSSVNFDRAGADFTDLEAIAVTHLHVDHINDLAAYLKGSFFSQRQADLLLFGPEGNYFLPDIKTYVQRLIGSDGVYPYLASHLQKNNNSVYLNTIVIPKSTKIKTITVNKSITLQTISVHHGPIMALAWRVNIGKCSISFSGDFSDQYNHLTQLIYHSDILISNHAIAENAHPIAKQLHHTPTQIAKIAKQAKIKQLILSHRMNRTKTQEKQSLQQIKVQFSGQIIFAKESHLYQ